MPPATPPGPQASPPSPPASVRLLPRLAPYVPFGPSRGEEAAKPRPPPFAAASCARASPSRPTGRTAGPPGGSSEGPLCCPLTWLLRGPAPSSPSPVPAHVHPRTRPHHAHGRALTWAACLVLLHQVGLGAAPPLHQVGLVAAHPLLRVGGEDLLPHAPLIVGEHAALRRMHTVLACAPPRPTRESGPSWAGAAGSCHLMVRLVPAPAPKAGPGSSLEPTGADACPGATVCSSCPLPPLRAPLPTSNSGCEAPLLARPHPCFLPHLTAPPTPLCLQR